MSAEELKPLRVYVIRRRINWRYIATRAAVGFLFALGAVALAAAGYLLAWQVQTIAGYLS